MADVKEVEAPPKTGEPERDTQVRTKPKKPSMYNVILLNDDYTPMDFVVAVLIQFFHKGPEEATAIMLDVHKKGKGIAGTYTREVAETKVDEVLLCAKMNEHPLQVVMEKAD